MTPCCSDPRLREPETMSAALYWPPTRACTRKRRSGYCLHDTQLALPASVLPERLTPELAELRAQRRGLPCPPRFRVQAH